jgi:hypothetical protein
VKLAGIAAAAAAGALVFAATAATQVSAASTSQPPCIPKLTQAAVDYCGPATAVVKVASKTYNFKGGYCSIDPKNKITIQLALGVISHTGSSVNDGKPLFQLSELKADGITVATITADWRGKQLESVGTVALKGSVPSSGTFTSKGFSSHFSGSWNCHGVVVTTP